MLQAAYLQPLLSFKPQVREREKKGPTLNGKNLKRLRSFPFKGQFVGIVKLIGVYLITLQNLKESLSRSTKAHKWGLSRICIQWIKKSLDNLFLFLI